MMAMVAVAASGGRTQTDQRYFDVILERRPTTRLAVVDRRDGRDVLAWRGRLAAEMLARDSLKDRFGCSDRFIASKEDVRRLALMATSVGLQSQASRGRGASNKLSLRVEDAAATAAATRRWSRLDTRLRRAGGTLPDALRPLARRLLDGPVQHLSIDDAACFVAMQGVTAGRSAVSDWFDKLAGRGLLQRIVVDDGTVFYDLETRPHVHIYDPETGELQDAVVDGVLKKGSNRISIQEKGSNRISFQAPSI